MSFRPSDGARSPPSEVANAATVRHVRRAVRVIGPATAAVPGLFTEAAGNARHSRSQSTQLGPSVNIRAAKTPSPQGQYPTAATATATTGNGGPRRNTISAGTVPAAIKTSKSSIESNGLVPGSAIRYDGGEPSASASPSLPTALNCPICGVMAPSLFALNMHLDETHFAGDNSGPSASRSQAGDTANADASGSFASANDSAATATGGVKSRYASQDDLEDVKGAILGFFRGAGRAVKGLGALPPSTGPPSSGSSDQGSDTAATAAAAATTTTTITTNTQNGPANSHWRSRDKDGADLGIVTREHWQQFKQGGRCSLPACTLVLSPQTGIVNCRKCGRSMCGQHCNYRLLLTPAAQASARGTACRVCEECFMRSTKSRQDGPSRDLTMAFTHLRRKAVSTALLEGNRMEKRLEKLSMVYASTQPSGSNTFLLASTKSIQAAEQSVVPWEDDAEASACPFCNKQFGRLASRRHHCRLCGRVVCGRSSCSTLLSIPLPSSDGAGFSADRCVDVRACRECEHVVIRHRDRASRANRASDQLSLLYAEINKCMVQVEDILPTFNALAVRLHDAGLSNSPDLPRAARIRRQLTAAFNSLDQISKRILQLPAETPTAKRLHLSIRRAVAQYLQLHMFPLTMLPKPERRLSSASSTTSASTLGRTPRTPTPLRNHSTMSSLNSVDAGGAEDGSDGLNNEETVPESPASKHQSAGESEEQAGSPFVSMSHHEKLESISVLRDQRERVKGYINEAQRERRLDDAMSLQSSLKDLEAELALIEQTL